MESVGSSKKKRTVTLHALTAVPHLAQHFAPAPLAKNTPAWWKTAPLKFDMPPPSTPQPHMPPPSDALAMTIKHCYAVRELFSRAVLLPLWADYAVIVSPDGRTFAHSPQPVRNGEQHPAGQYPGMLHGWAHYKFLSPWLLHTDEMMHFYYAHPFYHYKNPGGFQTMPGVIEFHFQHHAHVNCVFPVHQKNAEYVFRVGDPIAYLVPMEDVHVVVKAQEVSQQEIERLTATRQLSFHHHKLNRKLGLTMNYSKRKWPWQR